MGGEEAEGGGGGDLLLFVSEGLLAYSLDK